MDDGRIKLLRPGFEHPAFQQPGVQLAQGFGICRQPVPVIPHRIFGEEDVKYPVFAHTLHGETLLFARAGQRAADAASNVAQSVVCTLLPQHFQGRQPGSASHGIPVQGADLINITV